jgi:hypothetical protein
MMSTLFFGTVVSYLHPCSPSESSVEEAKDEPFAGNCDAEVPR